MKQKAKPTTLQAAIRYFSDEQTCIDTVAALRWPDGVTCPACEHKEHYWLASQKRWKCKDCGRQFSVKLNTIFEDSPISLDKWLVAIWMLANCRNGVSSYELARTVGVTQKSAWFMLHRIRLAMRSGSLEKIGGSGSEVECDETHVGAVARNMHKDKKLRFVQQRTLVPNWKASTPARYGMSKTPVMGMLDASRARFAPLSFPTSAAILCRARF